MTLADDDTNSIFTYNDKRTMLGNVLNMIYWSFILMRISHFTCLAQKESCSYESQNRKNVDMGFFPRIVKNVDSASNGLT